jgi:hypothetical protein
MATIDKIHGGIYRMPAILAILFGLIVSLAVIIFSFHLTGGD